MDSTVDQLAELLLEEGIDWDPTTYRLRCFGHVLNLPVQAFLFMKDDEAVKLAIEEAVAAGKPLDAVMAELSENSQSGWHKTVPMIKIKQFALALRSNKHYQPFKQLAGKMIHLPNDTRWNSWATMIEDAFQVRPAVTQYIADHPNLHHLEISLSDWQALDEAYRFMSPFKEACKQCEGDSVTLDQVITDMDIIVKHFETMKAKHANKTPLLSSITTAWYVFDKYYKLTDETPLYAAAVLLHPFYRKQYLDEHWRRSWIEPSITRARDLWKDEYAARDAGGSDNSKEEATAAEAERQEEPSFFQLQRRLLQRPRSSEDEFDRFIKGQQLQPADPLSWWLEPTQQRTYPRLSQMAIDVLSAPSMSAESERVWSMAKKTIAIDRRNLSSESLAQSECMKSWIHHGFADEGDSEAGDLDEASDGTDDDMDIDDEIPTPPATPAAPSL
jgi:hypothetical protein